MERSILACAAAALLACAALPCLAEDAQDPKAAPAAQQAAPARSAPKDAAAPAKDASKDGASAQGSAAAPAASSFQVPEVNVKNCSDKAVLDKVLARIKQAGEKNDLDRDGIESIKDFSEKCKAVLQNR